VYLNRRHRRVIARDRIAIHGGKVMNRISIGNE
jgi:hypothetical protein